MVVRFEVFSSEWENWEKIFGRAAKFATEVGPERLIGISHSESPTHKGVVTVWYWDKEGYDPDLS